MSPRIGGWYELGIGVRSLLECQTILVRVSLDDESPTGKPPLIVGGLTLTPVSATALFVLAVIAGYRYRRVWKQQGPAWQAWLFGSVAAACLLALGFIPLRGG
ncbi:MAG: hypothetical protein AAGE18_12715 [Pseudomonadota bacterium]